MASGEVGQLIYLIILGSALLAYFVIANRSSLGQALRHAALWGMIFIGAVAGFGLWQDIRRDFAPLHATVSEAGQIQIPRAFDGHYYLTLEANGTPIRFVIDTGATNIVLSSQDANRIGIDPDDLRYLGVAHTANGQTRTARVSLDTLALGPIIDRNVTVWINEGEMKESLLGMAYLQRFDRLEISKGMLVLVR